MPQAPATVVNVHFVAAGKYHDIDFARLEILKLLAEHAHIRTSVASDYADLDRLAACDVLLTYTCDLLPTPEQTAALRTWVEGGGKWFALHGTNSVLRFLESGLVDCPDDNPPLMELLGTQFKAHPPIGPFKVVVSDRAHPLTRGLDDFHIVDELYLSETRAPIHTLLHTRFTGEATGFVTADWQDAVVPVLYIRNLGSGGVLYLTLGHCRSHYDVQTLMPFWPHPERCGWNYPVYYELLRRGLGWATSAA